MNKESKKSPLPVRILKILLCVAGVIVLAAAVLIGYLTAAEYYPKENEELALSGEGTMELKEGDSLKVMTWNIGYGSLGETADFFMDGGTHVKTADEAGVRANMDGMLKVIKEAEPDFILLQEADRHSARSSYIDEAELVQSAAPEGCEASFAYNYKVPFVPFPLPPIGQVESGILTLSKADITSSVRVPLPCPFSWPVRVANLKRCIMVDRIPVEGSGRELVLINLHLEAYDKGEGKAAQTKLLMDFVEKEREAGNYVIAGGDFNQRFSNVDISEYPKVEGTWQPGEIDTDQYEGSWQFLMDNSVPTCRSLDKPLAGADKNNFQYYMIDGFLVSSNVEVKSLETRDEGFVYTDHNPVVMEVVLK